MNLFSVVTQVWSEWIQSTCTSIAALLARFESTPTYRLSEQADGNFIVDAAAEAVQNNLPSEMLEYAAGKVSSNATAVASILRGSNVELILGSDRFLFRPLELPARAAAFTKGIVTAQIDRLTPWNANSAAFGWTAPPLTSEDEKVTITVAATPLATITPYIHAFTELGAKSISVMTSPSEADSGTGLISVWKDQSRDLKNIDKIRTALIGALAGSAAITAVGLLSVVILGTRFAAERDEIDHSIAKVHAASASAGETSQEGFAKNAVNLTGKKRNAPSTVLILEALSKVLPDQTYVTELRVEGDKLQLVGVSRDAPALIGLIEQTGRFSQATFFAPTTRAASNAGDRFSIEAVINPGSPSS